MAESFTVEVQHEEVALLLKKVINSPHNEIITRIIMGNLETTSFGLSQLYKALNGIDNKIKWKVGTSILIKRSNIYSADIDNALMIEKGMLHQGYIKGHIIKIDLYSYSNITIEFDVLTTKGYLEKRTYAVNDITSIVEDECYPGEDVDKLPF